MLRPDYPLETDRLRLRPYTEADLESLHDLERRKGTARYLYNEPLDLEQSRALLRRRMKMTAIDEANDDLALAIELKATDALIGHVTLERKSVEHRQGEIGYVLHPDHHGHGYATEAAEMMLRPAPTAFSSFSHPGSLGLIDARARCGR
jgi:RimJ/RimL family protein N-acetyltransferase